jgi:hypothetical protein
MSIYKEIKNTGIDLFVSYHPKVIQLKKESKVLHKELKSKGLSLMQCQELAAKQNGFHNWYNFIHLIKRHYQQDLDNVPFILTTSKHTPLKSDYQTKFNDHVNNSRWLGKDEEDNPILLGYDINFGHYKWQNDSSMKTHQLILGQSIYKRYDVYLANQTMKNNRSMVFFNGEGDNDTLKSLVNSAIENKRQSNLKVINFKNSSVFPEYEYKIQDNFSGSSGMLTEMFFSMIDAEESLKAKIVSLISSVMMYLVYKRDLEKKSINLEKIRATILLENIVAASKEKALPDHISMALRVYLNNLSEKKSQFSVEELLVKHEEVRQPFDNLLKVLVETKLFDSDEKSINLSSFIDKDKSHTYIFQFESNDNRSELLQKLLLNSIKGSIATKLGATIEGSTDQIQAMTKQNRNVLYVFIRSCFTPKGIAVLPAQARSLGLSINFSYSSLSRLEELSSQREVEVMVANTNTKIFSTLEGDYQTVALLEKYKNEVSEESVLNLRDDSISVNINFNRRKNDHVWLVKRGYASQVSFDSPYEPTSIVASDNIKVFMKLEDPKETYDLFENMGKSTD